MQPFKVGAMIPQRFLAFSARLQLRPGVAGVLARELGPKKIRVNSINPGMVETEGTVSAGFIGSDFEKDLIKQSSLGRTGQPADIASIATFLASDDSYWLTGEQLLATGGIR